MNRRAAIVALCLAPLACKPTATAEDDRPGTSAVQSIDSIDPIRAWFNAEADKPRFLTILSPT